MGRSKNNNDDNGDATLIKWKNAIISILEGDSSAIKATRNVTTDDDATGELPNQLMKVKKLRKLVVLSMQLDDDENDKGVKKSFKHTIQTLEMENRIHLDEEGHVTLITKKKKKSNKRLNDAVVSSSMVEDDDNDNNNTKSKKKKQRQSLVDDDDGEFPDSTNNEEVEGDVDPDHQPHPDGTAMSHKTTKTKKKNVPCSGNPQGITRLFVGNLSFNINEVLLEEFIPGLTHVKWITDKTSGKFYGSAFIELDTSQNAANAVATKNGQTILGRPIKMNYAPALPGETWPPDKKVITGGGSSTTTTGAEKNNGSSSTTKKASSSSAGGVGLQGMSSTKPENCCKLFIGNLSYEITDETITKFFASMDIEVKAVRWIHHKESGDFKGVGFVEFWNTEACEKAATLNGKNLLGRPIRIDWTD